MRWLFLTLVVCVLVLPAHAQYSGGAGVADDPYQIATAADLIALGETPDDYDKHFILTAEIDLDPNLPGRTVFDRAVIAPNPEDDWRSFRGGMFTGSLDGQGHTIAGLVIDSDSEYAGLFGLIGDSGIVSRVRLVGGSVRGAVPTAIRPRCGTGSLAGENRGLIQDCHCNMAITGLCVVGGLVGENRGAIVTSTSAGSVNGTQWVGGLVGHNNSGTISTSCSTASVAGTGEVGGLVGSNVYVFGGFHESTISLCFSTGSVTGTSRVGGLVGSNNYAAISTSCSTGSVVGTYQVGGLAGSNGGTISISMSTGSVTGTKYWVGGLVGSNNYGTISLSVSTGLVTGTDRDIGGLVGRNKYGTISNCFWDVTTSAQASSAGGTGLATAQLQDVQTFLDIGWDFLGERENGTCEMWAIPEEGGYPVLSIFNGYTPPLLQGEGTFNEPYLLKTADDLGAVCYRPGACYQLVEGIDLSGIEWGTAVIPAFCGRFDGQGHRIQDMTISGIVNLGFFGILGEGAEVLDLGLEDMEITGTACVASLAARNHGLISTSYSTGSVTGTSGVGGLVGYNISGVISSSHNTGSVTGTSSSVGGLAASNSGTISTSHNTGSVSGRSCVGGLVGYEYSGTILNSYNTGSVTGTNRVGGLVGRHYSGTISTSYSTGLVIGNEDVGGLLGVNDKGTVLSSFWDTTTCERNTSAGGTGLTTAEMQTASTFLEAGWDFVDETENGTEDIWWILEGQDYPRLWWERGDESPL